VEQRAWRTKAGEELRGIADRLTNEDFPPAWLVKALKLPAPDDLREAGKLIRRLSNNLFAEREGRREQEKLNTQDRDEARRLLGCPVEREARRPRISN
jgi:hypothetical protein